MSTEKPILTGHEDPTRVRWWNLPTIWSGGLAGAWLGGYWPGAESWERLTLLLLGASALHVAATTLEVRRHGRDPGGWALVGFGRWLLYVLASAASSQPALAAASGEGLLSASYAVGSSVLERADRRPGPPPRWPWLLVALPMVVALPLFWLGRIVLGRAAPLGVRRVGALAAGAALVDLSAVAAWAVPLPWLGTFAVLFALALACQKLRPAA